MFGVTRPDPPSKSIASPNTYKEWSDILELLEAGKDDDAVAFAIAGGKADFGSGSMERLGARWTQTFDTRLVRISNELNRALQGARDEIWMGRALLDARRKLLFLLHVATLTVVHPTISRHLVTMLDSFAAQADSSLQESAKTDRSGRTAQIMRHNALAPFRQAHREVKANSTPIEAPCATETASQISSVTARPLTRARRVLL